MGYSPEEAITSIEIAAPGAAPYAGGSFDGKAQLYSQATTFGPMLTKEMSQVAEVAVAETDPQVKRAKLELLASLGRLLEELSGNEPPVVLDDGVSLEHAVNQVCATLPVEPWLRQGLLAENDLMARQGKALEMLNDVLDTVMHLKSRDLVKVAERDLN